MSHHQQGSAAADAALRGQQRQQLAGMSAFDRHKKFMHDYLHYYGGKLATPQQTVKTDYDTLKEQYRFIRSEEDDMGNNWEVRLAHKYYGKLFKEYAIIDLSRYKEGAYGMRWRTEKEVIAGRGQFTCGAKGCDQRQGLASFEVPFGYHEAGKQKQALVKVRLCPEHALQLNYRKNKEALKAQKRAKRAEEEREERRRKRKKRKSSLVTTQIAAAANTDSRQADLGKWESPSATPRAAAAANTDSRQADLGGGADEGSPALERLPASAVSADAEKSRGQREADEGPGDAGLNSRTELQAPQSSGRTDEEQLEPHGSEVRAVEQSKGRGVSQRRAGEQGKGRVTAERGEQGTEEGTAKGEGDGLDRRKGMSEDDRWQMGAEDAAAEREGHGPDHKKGKNEDDRWQMAGSRGSCKGQDERVGWKGSPIDDDTLFADLFL